MAFGIRGFGLSQSSGRVGLLTTAQVLYEYGVEGYKLNSSLEGAINFCSGVWADRWGYVVGIPFLMILRFTWIIGQAEVVHCDHTAVNGYPPQPMGSFGEAAAS